MSKRAIIEFLRKNKNKFFSTKEIIKGIGANSRGNIYNELKEMRFRRMSGFKDNFMFAYHAESLTLVYAIVDYENN